MEGDSLGGGNNTTEMLWHKDLISFFRLPCCYLVAPFCSNRLYRYVTGADDGSSILRLLNKYF